MANEKQLARLQRDAQVSATPDEAHAAQIEGRLKDLHTCLPGVIVSYDAATQTASVQPSIQRLFLTRGLVNLPLCVDVPVAFPGGGDFFLTFPVQAGDECLLFFSERSIDNWHVSGGIQPPSEYRLHDLSDGLAVVGLNSQPRKIPSVHATGAEWRNRAGTMRLRLLPDGTIHASNAGGSLTLSPSGQLAVSAPAGVTIAGDVVVTGTLTATVNVIAAGKSLIGHVHSGVQAGGSNTGPPV